MNERYALEPAAPESAAELRALLRQFGPYAGRYVVACPRRWREQVLAHCAGWGEVEQARVRSALRQAHEQLAVVQDAALPWDDRRDWLANATALRVPAGPLDGLIAARTAGASFPTPDTIDLPPTAERRIASSPAEYARASHTLLHESPELVFVDPYLDPRVEDVRCVLEAMLRVAAAGRCERITLWARHAEVTRRDERLGKVLAALRALRRASGYDAPRALECFLVDDHASRDRLHARYLLSKHGAIRFDKGFQQQSMQRKVDVAVVGRHVHEELCALFLGAGGHDLDVVFHGEA